MIHVLLVVKFRAGGITFGSMRREWSFQLDIDRRLSKQELLNFSERGVTLVVGVS